MTITSTDFSAFENYNPIWHSIQLKSAFSFRCFACQLLDVTNANLYKHFSNFFQYLQNYELPQNTP